VVGYLHERETSDPGELLDPIQLRFDEARDSGELDRPVDVKVAHGFGLPEGTAKALEDAWSRLADSGALVIIGPGNTDNALAVKPLAEARRIPTINWSGSERSRGEYNFHYQLGSLPDEGPLLVRALAANDFRRVAVIRDRSAIGDEYWDYFSDRATSQGISVISDQKVFPVVDDLSAEVARAREAVPDALVYLGIGLVLVHIMAAQEAQGWHPPCFTNTAGLRYYGMTPDQKGRAAGWIYVDMYDENNASMQAMLDCYEARYRARPAGPLIPCMYDMASLVVEALRQATVHTPWGVKEGLERVHQQSATCGGAGTVQGFGPWERTALKGPDFLVLRQMGATESTRYPGLPPTYEKLAPR
jgi:branched-chain amino acid transport system substrate-binding protein